MSNKKVLSQAKAKLNSAKAPAKPKDIIYDPMGQWKFPGLPTRIPSSNITMQDVPFPVMAYPNIGQPMLMQPGGEYNFPNADYVDEYPQMRRGGLKKGKTSRNPFAINKAFAKHQAFRKPRKNVIFDPNSPNFQDGGVSPLEGNLISNVIMNRNKGVDFVDRAYALGDNPETPMFNTFDDEEFGSNMSHKMAWGEDDNGQTWMFPTIFNPNNEAIQVPNQYADYISNKGYKNATGMNYQDGGFIMDLTSDEIKKYVDGGYIVEELDTMAKGGSSACPSGYYWNGKKCVKIPSNAFVTDNESEYNFRKAAYTDSSDLHKLSLNLKNFSGTKPVIKEKYDEIEEWQKKQPTYSFDEISYQADKKAKKVKDFEHYVYDINKEENQEKFEKNIGKDYTSRNEDLKKFEKILPDGKIKTPILLYKGNPDWSQGYTIYDPKTTSYRFYQDNKLSLIFNDKIKPTKIEYYADDKPDYSNVISVSSVNQNFTNGQLVKSSNSKKEFVSPYWVTDKIERYPKPIQPVILSKPYPKKEQQYDKKAEEVQTVIEPVREAINIPQQLPILPLTLIDTSKQQLQGEYQEDLPPQYQMPGYKVERPGFYMASPHSGQLIPHQRLIPTTVTKPTVVSKALQKFTGYNPEYSEGYVGEDGYVPGEFENAETQNRRINFQGASSLKDLKAQKEYNKAYDEYEAKERYKQMMANSLAMRFKQKGGFIEAELSEDEIQAYKDGGYIVEDISVPELQDGSEPELKQDLQEQVVYGNEAKRKLQGSLIDKYNQAKGAYQDYRENAGLTKQRLKNEGASSIGVLQGQIKEYKNQLEEEKKTYDKAQKALNVLQKKDPKNWKDKKLKDVMSSQGVDALRDLYSKGEISEATHRDFYNNFGQVFDRETKTTSEEDQKKLEKSWYGDGRWMDNPMNVAKVAKVAPYAALAAAGAPAVLPILANPLVQAGLTGYGVYDAATNSIPQAFKDFKKGDYKGAAWNAGMAALDLAPIPLFGTNLIDDASRAGKYLTTKTPLKNTYKLLGKDTKFYNPDEKPNWLRGYEQQWDPQIADLTTLSRYTDDYLNTFSSKGFKAFSNNAEKISNKYAPVIDDLLEKQALAEKSNNTKVIDDINKQLNTLLFNRTQEISQAEANLFKNLIPDNPFSQRLGSGSFGSVYEVPNINRTVKLGKIPSNEDAALLVEKTKGLDKSNIAIPTRIEKLPSGEYATVMNKVDPITKPYFDNPPTLDMYNQLIKDVEELQNRGVYLDFNNKENIVYNPDTGKFNIYDLNTTGYIPKYKDYDATGKSVEQLLIDNQVIPKNYKLTTKTPITSSVDDVGRGVTNTNELPPPPNQIFIDNNASLNLQRAGNKSKKNIYKKTETINENGFDIKTRYRGDENIPADITIEGKSGYWQLKPNKAAGDNTWAFSANMDNQLESGKAMLKMNEKFPFPKPSILEPNNLSLDSYNTLLNMGKRKDWSMQFENYVPLNHSAKHSTVLKELDLPNTPNTSIFKSEAEAQRALEKVNEFLVKKGINEKAKVYSAGDSFGIKIPNFRLTRNYAKGGAIELELTPEEIEWYKSQGYIVEEID